VRLYGKAKPHLQTGAALRCERYSSRSGKSHARGWPRNRTPFALKLPALCAFCVLQARLWLRDQLVRIVSWFGTPVRVSRVSLAVSPNPPTLGPETSPRGKSVFYGLRKRSIAGPMSASALTSEREAAEAMLTDWLADEPDWVDARSVERIELEDRSSPNYAGGPKPRR
jgi:hypothetical protein